MDPISQGAFGAIFAQTQGKPKMLAKAAVIGFLAGMAPDLDVLIRSADDDLLALEYHRHFTHSLLFIPFGALICAGVLYPLLGRFIGVCFSQIFIWSTLAIATHGLLDSFTSYGTQLLWPLTNHRFAFDIISIIDPLLTLPILGFIIFAAYTKKRYFALIGIGWALLYFGFSSVQHMRAIAEGQKLAETRGIAALNIEAKPSFANIRIWKIITTTQDAYYIDAVKVGFGKSKLWEGQSVKKLDMKRDLPWLTQESQQREDIERFRWFSNGYIALDKDNPYRIVDVRYSMLPQDIRPLWGIELSPYAQPEDHVIFYHERGDSGAAIKELWQMLF